MASDLLEISGNVFNTVAISQTRFSLPPFTPTPAAVRASGINGEPAQPLGGDLQILADELLESVSAQMALIRRRAAFGALFFMDLASGEAFTFGDEFAFSGTSLNKIAILAKLYQSLTRRRLDRDGHRYSQHDDLQRKRGDQSSAEHHRRRQRLLRRGRGHRPLPGAGLGAVLLDCALHHDRHAGATALTRWYFPKQRPTRPSAAPDLSNQLTVVEIGSLLANLYQCAYGSGGALIDRFGEAIEARECRQMLHVMSNNTVDALLKSGVPADTRVAHKHGWIPDTHGNAALFFTPGGDYVIAMMLFQPEWLNFQESLPLFAEVSRRVYNHFNPEQPQGVGPRMDHSRCQQLQLLWRSRWSSICCNPTWDN